ncbi:MAG: phosphate ABC transporter substrate-binding protein [Burkholderiales bacterium]|nr:phosphate ABC transporter substrate-binding protein [Burkholderiales bacterium]
MNGSAAITLRMLLGDYPGTRALKQGAVVSPFLRLEFADAKVPNRAFKQVVREAAFDAAELAIVTYLQALAFGEPLVLLPAAVLGRFQHGYLAYNPARGPLAPSELAGRRVGIRSSSVTTVAWIRGILAGDYGVDLDRVRWVTFEDAHVAEARDPPGMERAPAGREIAAMLRDGELDAAVLGEVPAPDSGLRPLIAEPDAAAQAWYAKHRAVPVNHLVVVKRSLADSRPDAVRELYRLLLEGKRAAAPAPAHGVDLLPFGVDALRPSLELIVEYAFRQRLIPRRFAVDELFDDVTRSL